jgi:hypothetical protein
MSQLNAQSSTFDIIWRLVFTGAGQALFPIHLTEEMLPVKEAASGVSSLRFSQGRL